MVKLAFLFWLLIAAPVWAQGYAGLGTSAEGFAVPERGRTLSFPEDHGPHPEFRIEWWYLTATLKGEYGRDYGIQWTLFRSALAPEAPGALAKGWASPQIWMGHAAVTTPNSHHFAERLARGGIGQAGVTAAPFSAWIDDWQMRGSDFSALDVSARGTDFAYDLTLSADTPLVLHGDRGYSVKSADGQASYYYSQPAYRVSGKLKVDNRDIAVTGAGWLDREWSSQPLAEDQSGWDWFSLGFDSGDRLMGFRLRGARGDFTSGTWIGADGTVTSLEPGEFQAEPLATAEVEGRQIPVKWQVSLPGRGVDATVSAANENAWMGTSFSYWEGPVRISGSHTGRGYLEMTGYGESSPSEN
ncbi:lipocalin-like domain-containing protein [Primorskyibacter sp. S87]|uniref:lipocalin-like domain-containing protein n=1 Tax=Primorskyibacter sp. S87 TaxID=3415126 RepID=UPI003C7D275C